MAKTNINIFEYAAKNKLRFPSIRGQALSVEQLWDVPLRSNDDFNLNIIAKSVSKMVGTASEESFVDAAEKKTKEQRRAEICLDIVKHVIQTKLNAEDTAKTRAENKKKEEKLLEILANKQMAALEGKSETQIRRELEALHTDSEEE